MYTISNQIRDILELITLNVSTSMNIQQIRESVGKPDVLFCCQMAMINYVKYCYKTAVSSLQTVMRRYDQPTYPYRKRFYHRFKGIFIIIIIIISITMFTNTGSVCVFWRTILA